jgi:hypothetical protein
VSSAPAALDNRTEACGTGKTPSTASRRLGTFDDGRQGRQQNTTGHPPAEPKPQASSAPATLDNRTEACDAEATPSTEACGLAEVDDGGGHDMGQCLFSIQHDGAYAEKLQWCPSTQALSIHLELVRPLSSSLLLAVLGNGCVHIWAVPHRLPPNYLKGQMKPGMTANPC